MDWGWGWGAVRMCGWIDECIIVGWTVGGCEWMD